MSTLLDDLQYNQQKLLMKMGKDIGEHVTIKIVDFYPDKKKIQFDFPDNWHIAVDEPGNIDNLYKDEIYIRFIEDVKKIRADQLTT